VPRARLLALLVTLAAVAGGCGADDVEREVDRARERAEEVRRDVQRRIEDAEREFEERRDRYGRRFDELLRDVEKVFERPERTSPTVRARGRDEPTTIDRFMTVVLGDVDRFWTRTFATSRLPEPRVGYNWIAPGATTLSACGEPATDMSAFYCPADDTIHVGQQFAADLYNGVLRGLPGEGNAAGDFAVAFVLAHEYAHSLQTELGIFDNRVTRQAKPFELQADCLAGVWAYSVFAEGALQPGDIEEAASAALATGDFDVGNAQHHGTPRERRDALLAGFETGDPASCNRFIV
jgi:predicted metalloprotease